MTKRIRVENADTNQGHRVMVHTQELKDVKGWETTASEELHVTALKEIMIHSHKRIIVQELLDGPAAEKFNESV